jgi:hypothetical protein
VKSLLSSGCEDIQNRPARTFSQIRIGVGSLDETFDLPNTTKTLPHAPSFSVRYLYGRTVSGTMHMDAEHPQPTKDPDFGLSRSLVDRKS